MWQARVRSPVAEVMDVVGDEGVHVLWVGPVIQSVDVRLDDDGVADAVDGAVEGSELGNGPVRSADLDALV